ncbi:energy-coupling factor transporter ATPase [Fructobacillus sp. M1-13]|uniref:Energy-coupling factor transporter ATPase n=1 Tax=Fructobacillus papyriferae TaxID=2713171 RepID=A0ABS5QQT6_9LACO|nr:energy-coupling factor transporter ATPase [Fructobacillus papyriferae]MBS9335563.1 energy-coupling factor transporter ATPase [Fructobacillus papyriferae]MCD2159347.1 energy-coupling factor transporter ATPase [Fructobacillus papyriferae]
MTDAITIKNLTYSYPDQGELFKGFDLTVQKGEWLSIVGHNGSGKSTLAKLILGLLDFDKGHISVFGKKLSEETLAAIRAEVGMVFQNPDNQFVGATVADDVAFGLENRQVPSLEMPAKIEAALRQVEMLDYAEREPHTLSGGQKQRVAMASVLALQPRVIILDEATAMLDPEGKQAVLKTIKELKAAYQEKLTMIVITHDMEEAALADRVVVLDDGQLVYDEAPETLFLKGHALQELGLTQPFAMALQSALGLQNPSYQSKQELATWLSTLKA